MNIIYGRISTLGDTLTLEPMYKGSGANTHYMYYELTPAYGRDYKSKAEVIAAWNEGKDFEGDYQLRFSKVNRDDIPKPCTVLLRYKRNTMVASVKVSA